VGDANRKIYESFLSAFDNIQQRSTLLDSTARIITAGSYPGSPSYPRSTLILALAILGSIVLAVGLAFIGEFLDGGFRTSTQIEEALGCPVLA